jgi:hypothetical protein
MESKDSKCCFCDENETIDHLFFKCKLARYVWGVVRCANGIGAIPVKFQDLSDWIFGFPSKDRNVLGVAAVVWSI